MNPQMWQEAAFLWARTAAGPPAQARGASESRQRSPAKGHQERGGLSPSTGSANNRNGLGRDPELRVRVQPTP